MRILLAEDRATLRQALAEALRRAGFEVVEAPEGRSAMAIIEEGGFDLGLFDLKMPVHSGLDLLKASKAQWPLVPAILLTAYGSVSLAVEAMKAGAEDFLLKPVDPDVLLMVVRKALEAKRQERIAEALATDLTRAPAFQGIVGSSPSLRETQDQASRISGTDTTCLLLGETGVGKELFARAIHMASGRASQPFVAVNCAALPATLLENELFGHDKGAYTGAHEARAGRFEYAHRGTIFLDEIAEMGSDLQAKLLRVIEDKSFYRVGGSRPVTVDVRVICATNRDLDQMVKDRSFREDLYYRLSAFPIRIPPLRERREDIPALATHFLDHFRRELARPDLHLAPGALEALLDRPWPGNIRELMNRMERASILAGPDGALDFSGGGGSAAHERPSGPAHLPFMGLAEPEAWLAEETSWRAEEVLRRCGGDRKRACRILGITPQKLEELVGGGKGG